MTKINLILVYIVHLVKNVYVKDFTTLKSNRNDTIGDRQASLSMVLGFAKGTNQKNTDTPGLGVPFLN